ncbi:MAG: pseudouridine synthase [Candidatus Latescibacteria bacterium]|jgi:tRNA pseudouridine65 synthase|nr:pseudouridine synthase [Candidatus Latescibacterota bacterium]
MLEILYRDGYYAAVNKPSGLFVHPSQLDRRAASCMPRLRDQLGRRVYPVHRLDRPTSGVLLFALNPEAARKMCRVFEQREVTKGYLAVVRGFAPESGRIDHPLREDKSKQPVEAVTAYTRKATSELPIPMGPHPTARFSLVRAVPHTGRMHQIRRHFSHISHPVAGDTNHGDSAQNRFIREHLGVDRLLLMATDLAFVHPYKQVEMTIRAPVPDDLGCLFESLDWQDAVHEG